jgi:hypothetical protein
MTQRSILTLLAAGALAMAAPILAPPARAYGVATHAWLAEEEAYRLAAADPSLAFLATDPEARACFMYGAIFPDMRSTARQVQGFEMLRSKVLASGVVASIEFSTDEVATAFTQFNTHGGDWLKALVARARSRGDRFEVAFALGNQAHALQDKHAQVLHIPSFIQRTGCGDLGVGPAEDPATAWHVGDENELFFEGFGDSARPREVVEFVRDAPWRLAANPTLSYNRALALRRFYRETAAAFQAAAGAPAPSERAILNAARVFEVSLTFYGFFTANEEIADTLRRFIERYVRLEWWAQALSGVAQAITNNIFQGADVFDVVGPLIAPTVSGQVGGQSVAADIMLGHAWGGADLQRIQAKYAANDEYRRLVASGMLDRATYHATSYELAHAFALDGILRGAASKLTDDLRWPTYKRVAWRTSAVRSLLRASGREDVAESPEVLIYDVRLEDAASGAALDQVALPSDVGRRLRLEVELYGASAEALSRVVGLRLRGMTAAGGAAEPVLASTSRIVAARLLDPRSYGDLDRPVVALEWTVADAPGVLALFVEVDERRLSLAPDPAAADALFTQDLRPLAPLMQGRAHYIRHYPLVGGELGAWRVRR